ncbi:hypothetical protein DL98DRAFT_579946 [Cadophora sp. DSE1049]|nr:hypothetical protein DL98DRAFT_579946 [Cadophora sp. DSE1049]
MPPKSRTTKEPTPSTIKAIVVFVIVSFLVLAVALTYFSPATARSIYASLYNHITTFAYTSIYKPIYDSLPPIIQQLLLLPLVQKSLSLLSNLIFLFFTNYALFSGNLPPIASTSMPTRRKAANNSDINNNTAVKTTRSSARPNGQILLSRVENLEREVLGAVAGGGG